MDTALLQGDSAAEGNDGSQDIRREIPEKKRKKCDETVYIS